MLKIIKNICLWSGILILVIAAIAANVWRPFSVTESGIMEFFVFSLILTAMLLQTIQNKDKNQHPSFYFAKLTAIILIYLDILWDTISLFF